MRLIAYFKDSPEMMAHRLENAQNHLDYLEKHKTEIPIAGGLRPEPGGKFVGGLWVMEVPLSEQKKL